MTADLRRPPGRLRALPALCTGGALGTPSPRRGPSPPRMLAELAHAQGANHLVEEMP